jgi:tetratricopeptide (TPR) repeat protein
MLSALKTFFLAESLRQPTIIELEDLHWLDDDSRRFLQWLLHDVDEYPLAIVASSRDEPAHDLFGPEVTLTILPLAPLARDTLQHFAGQQLAQPVAPALVTLLLEQSEGNPFFAEQILRYMQEENLLFETKEGIAPIDSEAHLPTNVQSVLVARLDQLAQTVKEVVQTAAVLGREFTVQVLSRMLQGKRDLLDDLRIGETELIWTALGELRYLFHHTLLREAAYEMQLRARLRGLHRLAAEAIEQVYTSDLVPHYADLVYHYRRAEIPARERVYARLAGEKAAEQFANTEAVAYLSRALELTSSADSAERFEILMARLRVYERQGARVEQRADLAALAELADALADPRRQAESALAYAEYAEAVSDFPAALTAAQRALALVTPIHDLLLQAKAHQYWGRALWRQGDYREAETHSEASLTLARLGELKELEADALIVLGIARWFLGDYTQAEIYLKQSLPLYAEIGKLFAQAPAWQNLGLIAQNRSDHASALSYLERALAIYRETGARQGRAITLTNLGFSYQRLGEYNRALDLQEQALQIFSELAERFGVMIVYGNLGALYLSLGDRVRARHTYREALDLCRQIGSRGYDSLLVAILAEIDFEEGKTEFAYERLQDALQMAREVGHRDNEAKILNKVGRVALALHKLAEAETAYEQALAIRRTLDQTIQGMEALVGLADVALAQGNSNLAMAHVTEILPYLQTGKLDSVLSPFPIYLTCYQVLQAVGDARAVALLNTAHHLLQTYASSIGDEKLRRSFLENVEAHRMIILAAAKSQ